MFKPELTSSHASHQSVVCCIDVVLNKICLADLPIFGHKYILVIDYQPSKITSFRPGNKSTLIIEVLLVLCHLYLTFSLHVT